MDDLETRVFLFSLSCEKNRVPWNPEQGSLSRLYLDPVSWGTCPKYRLLGSFPRLMKLDSQRVQTRVYIFRKLPRQLGCSPSGACLRTDLEDP